MFISSLVILCVMSSRFLLTLTPHGLRHIAPYQIGILLCTFMLYLFLFWLLPWPWWSGQQQSVSHFVSQSIGICNPFLNRPRVTGLFLNVWNALDFPNSKQFLELLSSIGNLVVLHNMCAFSQFPAPNPS